MFNQDKQIKIVSEVLLGCITAIENNLPKKRADNTNNYDLGYNNALNEIQQILNKYKN